MAHDEVYWKIIVDKDHRSLKAVCLQDHDERDYDQTRFLSQYKFASEDEANEVIGGFARYLGTLVMLGLL